MVVGELKPFPRSITIHYEKSFKDKYVWWLGKYRGDSQELTPEEKHYR